MKSNVIKVAFTRDLLKVLSLLKCYVLSKYFITNLHNIPRVSHFYIRSNQPVKQMNSCRLVSVEDTHQLRC